mgnify:CR=1 FL=1
MSKDNFNIIPSPSDMKERDDVLLNSFNNLIYFGRAFLPRDFLNKSLMPNPEQEYAILYHVVMVNLFSLKRLLYINSVLPVKIASILLLGCQKNRVRLLTI